MTKSIQCYWPPFFVIALICMVIALNGCASSQVDFSSQATATHGNGFATIADANDPVEMAAAPVVTRLTMYAYRAADLADADKLTRAQRDIIRIQERTLRAEVEDGVRLRDLRKINNAAVLLDAYFADLEKLK